MSGKSLTDLYMTTGPFSDHSDFTNKLAKALADGSKVVQLKNKNITELQEYLQLVSQAEAICRRFNSLLLLATSVDWFKQTQADGLHLNSQALFKFQMRPVADDQVLSVSCHNLQEMQQAEKLGADILLLSPLKATAAHPDLEAIGWPQFSQMIQAVQCPVYALGGMKTSDLDDAKQAGAQGVAVSSIWQ